MSVLKSDEKLLVQLGIPGCLAFENIREKSNLVLVVGSSSSLMSHCLKTGSLSSRFTDELFLLFSCMQYKFSGRGRSDFGVYC